MDKLSVDVDRLMREWGVDEPTAHLIARSLAGQSVGDVIELLPDGRGRVAKRVIIDEQTGRPIAQGDAP